MNGQVRAARRVAIAFAGVLSLGALAGVAVSPIACFPPPPPQKPDPCNVQIVKLRIYADENINPNDEDKPRSVLVRLYQLNSDTRILNARYEDLLFKDKETLGDQMLKTDEFEIFPNDVYEVKFERIPEASVLAGVAFFRSPIGNSYKTFYEFPPMPNTPEACGAPPAAPSASASAGPALPPLPGASLIPSAGPPAPVPQAFPSTEFFLRERKIDNGSEFDASMFPHATNFKKLNLPKASAEKDSQQAISPPPPPAAKK